jgi:hypothetical protein
MLPGITYRVPRNIHQHPFRGALRVGPRWGAEAHHREIALSTRGALSITGDAPTLHGGYAPECVEVEFSEVPGSKLPAWPRP